jgi:phosphoribosylanthranilate isomerase
MIVKICGITRLEDAEKAVEYGAGAIGFIFWPGSARCIAPQRAQAIIAALPPFVTPVGVFVNQPREDVIGVANSIGLGAVQLHGEEDAAYTTGLGRPVLKGLALAASSDESIEAWPDPVMLLLDAYDPVKRGGTGRTIDWTRAALVARRRRVVLAGGLTPDNVAEAVERVRPFAIDVSSGVESAPGIKDHGRLRALFDVVRQVGKQMVL